MQVQADADRGRRRSSSYFTLRCSCPPPSLSLFVCGLSRWWLSNVLLNRVRFPCCRWYYASACGWGETAGLPSAPHERIVAVRVTVYVVRLAISTHSSFTHLPVLSLSLSTCSLSPSSVCVHERVCACVCVYSSGSSQRCSSASAPVLSQRRASPPHLPSSSCSLGAQAAVRFSSSLRSDGATRERRSRVIS
uniref:Uncharacterized protein n=1 Tax=Leishmania guyanensis TaxID=5670 RepID=A0A1E1J0J1_LEIGU|nr:Hypothetical protein BN36_2845930 [Leishmania guyanensis]